jgi:ATP-dependent helicase/nuclease subunit A
MSEAMREDAAARSAALDVVTSCIVRAPAGSGKTELLTQRYLALLATVDEPEEIIAITFTRKAAGEMRSRIVEALELARHDAPEQEHKKITWELARRVQARDEVRGWLLRLHPARMRIQTIDSLDAELTRQMPLLSRFGAPLGVNELPSELYEEAARRSLRLLEEGDAAQVAAVEGLARHLDNNLPRIHDLLARMLARRDQWLRHTSANRAELEAGLAREVEGQLAQVLAALPRELHAELAAVLSQAGTLLRAENARSDIVACAGITALPPASAEGLAAWRGVAEFLLIKDGNWRQNLDKRQGTPTDEKALKARGKELLRLLAGEDAARDVLAWVPSLPSPHYSDAHWRVLEALLKLLPVAAAQLKLVFAERGEVDFAEVAQGALRALGEPEAPTDLALALDYRLKHLLVDEFQDTSVNQVRLLTLLTAGWQAGDGRTLFLVGDPAQSIYRFREAEVGLFLGAWQQGLGGLPLQALQLHANFRSRPALVEWCNDAFPRAFPPAADVARGAVPYVTSKPRREAEPAGAVRVHPFIRSKEDDAREAQARRMLEIITTSRAADAGARIAVLVRAKAHLVHVVRLLRRQGVRFQAVEIETLGQRPVVQDLMMITRALAHAGDRTAWLGVLRAPWCGLSLVDLHALAGLDHESTLPALMQTADDLAAREPRFAHTREVLLRALAQRARGSLRAQVEQTWLQLGGPAALADEEALADAGAFLELLEGIEEGGGVESVATLEQRLAGLFAEADPEADGALQLMTVHKAKGLEFEVVILPALEAAARGDEPDLMVWLERPRAGAEPDLLLAPLDAPGAEKDPLYSWVRELRREQHSLETTRLLYVAATRAREQLHLLGAVKVKQDEEGVSPVAPRSGSLLALLWPLVKADFERTVAGEVKSAPVTGAVAALPFTRLKSEWQLPMPTSAVSWSGSTVLASDQDGLEFLWVGETLRHVGTVVHRLLQRIAEHGTTQWSAPQRDRLKPLVQQLLSQAGVREEELAGAVADTLQAVDNTLADERGRWLLDAGHAEARCEYSLSLMRDGRLESGIIDRTFVDAEGTRWIVDYKTSRHAGTDVDAFLAQQRERYAPQLERYAFLMRGLGAPRVKVALYFPLMQRFLSWEPIHGPEP